MRYYVDYFVIGNNPSNIGGGYTVLNEHNNLIETKRIYKKGFTNNFGELLAVTRAIELADNDSEIYTDSKCVISWLWQGRSKSRKDLWNILQRYNEELKRKKIALIWVPREENLAGIYNETKLSRG